jgi:hypothetical protein
MTDIKTKYIILIWIILLILFTFYCIFRLSYINEEVKKQVQQRVQKRSLNNIVTSNFEDTQLIKKPSFGLRQPLSIVSYIDDINNTKLTDIPGCQDMNDNNTAVTKLGFDNCNDAFAYYMKMNLDVNDKYGKTKSLAEICPVSSKTPKYNYCLKQLLDKFNNNAGMSDDINAVMSDSINKRIDDRNAAISNIEVTLKPYIHNKDINDFNINMLVNNSVAIRPDQVIGIVDKYYQDKYKTGVETFIDNGNFVDSDTQNIFMGKYKPISGQFLALNTLVFNLYIDTDTSTATRKPTVSNSTSPDIKLMLTDDNNLMIVYKVSKLEKYKGLKNAIIFDISDIDIVSSPESFNVTKNILQLLGINSPSKLVLSYDEFVSTSGKKHITYRFFNDNLDTILVMEKIETS